MPQCSLNSRKSKETRGVKTFTTKTRRDVRMVPRVSEEHVCLHGKPNWWKNSRNKKGSPTEVNILRHPGIIKEGYHSMLNNPGEHSAASYISKTLWIRHHPYIWQHFDAPMSYTTKKILVIGCFSSFGVSFIQVYYSSVSL